MYDFRHGLRPHTHRWRERDRQIDRQTDGEGERGALIKSKRETGIILNEAVEVSFLAVSTPVRI